MDHASPCYFLIFLHFALTWVFLFLSHFTNMSNI
jgi:hypothetical protein